VRRPDSVAKTYLRVIEAIPDEVRQELDAEQAQHSPAAEEATEAPQRRAG
jgi:hypothetical protein